MNLYEKIKNILTADKKYRNSYKELIWQVLEDEGSVINNMITKSQFMECTDFESIRRTAQKVVENHKELDADTKVREDRTLKEKTGGHFVWNNAKKTYSREHLEDYLAVLHMKYTNPDMRTSEEWERDKIKGIQYRKMLDDLNTEELTVFTENLFGEQI